MSRKMRIKDFCSDPVAAEKFIKTLPKQVGALIEALAPSAGILIVSLRRALIHTIMSFSKDHDDLLYYYGLVHGMPEMTKEMHHYYLTVIAESVRTKDQARNLMTRVWMKYFQTNEDDVYWYDIHNLCRTKVQRHFTDINEIVALCRNRDMSATERTILISHAEKERMQTIADGEALLQVHCIDHTHYRIVDHMCRLARSREDFLRIGMNKQVSAPYRKDAIVKAGRLSTTNAEKLEVLLSDPPRDEIRNNSLDFSMLSPIANDVVKEFTTLAACWQFFGPNTALWQDKGNIDNSRHRCFVGEKPLTKAVVERTLALEWSLDDLNASQVAVCMATLCRDVRFTGVDHRGGFTKIEPYWVELWLRIINLVTNAEELKIWHQLLFDMYLTGANDNVLHNALTARAAALQS